MVCIGAAAVRPGYPLIAGYSETEIGSDPTGWTTIQGQDGVLYFGCRDLVTFDGDRWRTFALNAAHTVRGLDFAPGERRLWAGAVGEIGWFDRAGASWNFHSLRPHLPSPDLVLGDVWSAFAEGDGAVFVAENHVLRWNGSTLQVWPMPTPRRLRGMRADGRIFVQHRPTGLYLMGPDGPTMFAAAATIGTQAIFALWKDGEDWTILNENGVFRLHAGALEDRNPAASAYIRAHPLASAKRLADGRLALATLQAGLVILGPDGAIERTLDKKAGVNAPFLSSLFVDREGSLWATSQSAVFRIALDSPSTLFDPRAGLPGQETTHIARHGGSIFAAQLDGLYELARGSQDFVHSTVVTDTARALRSTPDGLWVGGMRNVTRVVDHAVAATFSTDHDVFALEPSAQASGKLLVGVGGEVLEYSPTTRELHRLATNVPNVVISIAEDDAGLLWLGTPSGLFVAERGTEPASVKPVDPSFGLPSVPGLAWVVRKPDGEILAFNDAGGWVRRPGTFRFAAIKDYPARPLARVASEFDGAGNLWLVHAQSETQRRTIARIVEENGALRWQPYSVEGLSEIGSPSSIFVESTPGTPTTLWIGGTRGLLRHEVAKGAEPLRPLPPLLFATARAAEAKSFKPIEETLPYSTRAVVFELAQPQFARRAALRLETRIDGIDQEWVPVGPNSQRELGAVQEGRYVLHARAIAETGATSDETTFTFTVAPPWWRTAPAILGVILALAPAGYGLYRLRLRTLRRRNLELEAKVKQRTEQLEQANAAKTQFVANMSHDIRNPLNGIVGLALALEDTKLDGQQREIVATLRECTTYLSTLVDDVLDFASIEAGRVELRPGPFVTGELLHSVVTAMKADTAESGGRLIVDLDPALPKILSGDAGRIQQILVNYVSNALKYAGGTIHLTATIPLRSPDEIEFSVSDEGPGISAAEQTTLFTKFTRLAGARQHQVPGTGLGLAACRLLADIMGGSVGVESQPGQGARFYLRLPLTPTSMPVAPEAGELPNTTVLLVEDTDYNALAATAVLRRLGLTCERARNGTEALQMFAAKRYNLVLLDRNLPDMDGLEVARGMRQAESEGGLRSIILAVTAYATGDDRERCLAAGMDAFVGKPLTPEKLRRILLAAANKMLASATVEAAPAPAAETGSTPIDTSLLSYLSDGTPGGLETQIERFIAALRDAQAILLPVAKSNDYHELATAAHRVLGQARMVGANDLCTVATELELAARAAEAGRCAELLRDVNREIEVLTATLRRRRPGALTT